MLAVWTLLMGLALAQEGVPPEDPVADAPELPDDGAKEPSWKRTGFGFGGIPAVNYNTDEGLGLGVVGSMYRYNGKTSPYKVGVTLIIFATTRGVHGHRLDIDALKLLNGRLRFTTRLNLDITKTNNFCGFGPDVTCDPAVAEARADALGLDGEARETFVRRYYLSSYIRPNLFLNGRWKLNPNAEGRLKTELMTTARVIYHLPGDFKNGVDSDPGNLISSRLDQEQGFLPVLQVGVMADTRDFESAPTTGYWVEGSVRGSTRYIGSDFDYFGFNTTARGYIPLVSEGRLVSATRLAFDGIVGDVPIREMAEMGGSQIYNFGGGLNSGRGVRQRRYLGRVKTLFQEELRWRFLHIEPFGVGVDLTLLGFTDWMLVATDWSSLDELGKPIPDFGGGLRLAFDDNFIIRVDSGFSAVEGYSPSIYIDLANLF
ncbi:MAG: BamA/TamA family outer membrane protein [Myxococcota bacterium]